MKSCSEKETMAFAAGMARSIEPGAVLALVGELGSGKTCFVKGLALGLGAPKKVCVSSPTFVLIHEYPGGRLPLYHFDFYRLEKKEEALNLNLEEYWEGKGVSVVEWADKFADVFPKRTKWIYFKFLGENVREIKC
ncbi:MAG: tRNA (adenosine(37)-N6)-threonylcarbamoyltransferase complex ATPase subunit type 1 TsaE [Deltaproteobacteria bacterium]|nr:tRNA (adenosine(37)-N6)-threonylcarbamoyltransferase complex ATPase subunit type 1 TsaE [Deltaproteobacteria bacterium]